MSGSIISKPVRIAIILLGLIGCLIFYNMQINKAQATIDNGETVLLSLRPVDPRALMLGDYMTLRYGEQAYPNGIDIPKAPNGKVILKLDKNNVAVFKTFDSRNDLSENEIRMNYVRLYSNQIRYGGDRFYFQEGTAQDYEAAEYGVFRIDLSGRAILVNLADEKFKIIEPVKPTP